VFYQNHRGRRGKGTTEGRGKRREKSQQEGAKTSNGKKVQFHESPKKLFMLTGGGGLGSPKHRSSNKKGKIGRRRIWGRGSGSLGSKKTEWVLVHKKGSFTLSYGGGRQIGEKRREAILI